MTAVVMNATNRYQTDIFALVLDDTMQSKVPQWFTLPQRPPERICSAIADFQKKALYVVGKNHLYIFSTVIAFVQKQNKKYANNTTDHFNDKPI